MSTLKKFSEWIPTLAERFCGTGVIALMHPDTGVPMKHSLRHEYFDETFVNNARVSEVAEAGVWYDIAIEPTFEAVSGFEREEGTNILVYLGDCILKPRRLMTTLTASVVGDNQLVEVAYFRDRGEGFEMIPGTDMPNEFRFGGVFEKMITQTIITLEQGDRIKLMFRNNTGANNVLFESLQNTLL